MRVLAVHPEAGVASCVSAVLVWRRFYDMRRASGPPHISTTLVTNRMQGSHHAREGVALSYEASTLPPDCLIWTRVVSKHTRVLCARPSASYAAVMSRHVRMPQASTIITPSQSIVVCPPRMEGIVPPGAQHALESCLSGGRQDCVRSILDAVGRLNPEPRCAC